ncbi:autotransporter outer membrane beta-barrel domain-containing protein [Escherichia coli]|nr:autotransporter outer membrane beta-barrel domain-containing protein [Escherichia coli]
MRRCCPTERQYLHSGTRQHRCAYSRDVREGARNLGEVRTGVEAKVNNNLSLWGNVGVQLGDKGYSDTQGMLGVKYSW